MHSPTNASLSGVSTPKIKVGESSLSQQSSIALRSSPSKFRTKKKKVNQLTLVKRGQFHVYDSNGVDRTPKILQDPDYQILEEWQPTIMDYADVDLGSSGSQLSLSRSFQMSNVQLYGSRHQISASLQMSFTNIANVDSYREPTRVDGDTVSERSEDPYAEAVPSAFRLRDSPSREFYPPHSKVPLVAKETESFTLFDMKSVIESSKEDNAALIKADNEYYEFHTYGEGQYTRKLNTSEQQTPAYYKTSQTSLCPKVPTKNNSTWVTTWKIYDEIMGYQEEKKDTQGMSVEDQWQVMAENVRYLNQSIIMERLLGVPTYRDFQAIYKHSLQLDPYALDIQFTYSAKSLFVLDLGTCRSKPVTCISINPIFPDIMAVSYGKFYYTDRDKGYICIWSMKNPKHPERFYEFDSSVLCLDFATWSPNYLAAGFLNGDLLVLDVSSFEIKILYRKNSITSQTVERIIFAKWWICLNIFDVEEERIMLTTGDGRVIQYRQRYGVLLSFQMMRITKMEGKVKGIDCVRQCEAEEIPMLLFPAARCVVRYPEDFQFYLVSGEDGTIHKCSTNFFTQHVESFLAHSGPVYALKFSPFCGRIFLTCGADGAVRLWAWDIFEPLICLTIGPDCVEDAAWSPRNSTIIASITDCNLHIWDLRRKTYYPASTIVHPSKVKFTCVEFTKTGENIILGDINGNVHVMAMYGMPFEEKFKQEILAASIEKELIVKPKLLKLLKKSGPPFSSA